MKKNKRLQALGNRSKFKILLLMKLMTPVLLIFMTQLTVSAKGQDKITIKLKNIELTKAMSLVEKQSDYRFVYNNNLIPVAKKIDATFREADLPEVMTKLLTGTGLSYKIMKDNLVVLYQRDDEVKDLTVKGTITDENGRGLEGASIKVKGNKTGTYTVASGEYSLAVPDNATLIISYVGYETVEIAVGGRTTIDVKLKAATQKMDEVVVIGYGSASKRDLTGSITKVAGKDIADKPNTNPVASLQGKVAGLSVVNNGTPGAAPDIRIRGTVSIGQVHPLYVVDGIFNDNIDYINPNDIESIEVLKDPSSLAIFGVKGATGVIAITTKKAKAGQVVVNFNTSYGTKKLVDKIKLADATQFKTLFDEENANNGVATPDYSALTANTDWIDAVTRTGKFNNNNLSISGSTEKNRFNFGLGYLTDEGIIKHEKLEKILLSFGDEFKVNKAIKIGINFNASRQNNPYNATSVLDNARKVMPQVSAGTKPFSVANPYGGDSMTVNLYSGLDNALQNSGVVNPLLELENTWNKQVNIEFRTVASVYGEINFLKYFNFRSTFYADMSTVNNRQYSPLYYAYDPLNNTPYLYGAKTQVSENDNSYKKFQQDHILTFRKSFGDHNLTATAGFTSYYFGNFNRSGVAKPYTTGNALPIPDDKRFWYMTNGFEDPTTSLASSSQSEYSTVSMLGRILYNYKQKYFLNASVRDDASSQIPEKNRHQQFWALGGAWEISKEDFMKGQTFLNYLKLKGSVGVLGNQTAVDPNGLTINYPFYPRLNTGIAAVFGTNIYGAAQPSYVPNPDLKWETVSAQEAGFELSAFRNRLHFEANYFNKTTNNLMSYLSKASIGLPDQLTNGGSLRNWGEEFSASWNQAVNRDFSVNIGGNITFLKNKVLSIAEGTVAGYFSRAFQNNGSAESRTQPGLPIGSFYGYEVEGLYQSYADILKSPVASAIGAYRPGDFKFKDLNGDGKITADDRTVIGNPTPKFTYGTSVNLTYKSLSLAVDMGGVYGNQIFRTWGSLESPFQRVNYSAEKINRWHGAGTSNWVPILSQGDRFNYNGSSYNIEDGSYFRIRNVQLAFNFSQRLLSKAKIKNLRVYLNVQNVKTWKNNLGYTAEYGGDATAFGYDNAGGAIPLVSTAGLNVTF
ncbi:MAG: TonB-dependent receptor [Ferruginibacter sp.]|nr:TonB-dependent receptor [Ferruginibacter sp.]